MREILRRAPRDVLLYLRIGGLAVGAIWIASGSTIIVPIAAFALLTLFASIIFSWTAQASRGRTFTLTSAPVGLVLADLATAVLWMVATAPDPRSVAFVLVLITAGVVPFRLGRRGIVISAGAFAFAVVAQQIALVLTGGAFEPRPVLREAAVVGLALLAIGVVSTAFRDEQERATRALARARLLERAATEISAETDPNVVLASIPKHAMPVTLTL